MKPFVSIIVASYNYEDYIKETLDSLCNQTYNNWEALVIDDGSKDSSVDVIKEYQLRDSRIKLLQHPKGENKGLSKSLKYAINKSKGKYIVFCESDDALCPTSIEERVGALEQNEKSVLCFSSVQLVGDEEYISEYREYIDSVRQKIATIGSSTFSGKEMLKENNPIFSFSCVAARAKNVKECNFDSPYDAFTDWWLWKQMSYMGKIIFLDKDLTRWRIHKKSFMKQIDDLDKRNAQLKEEAFRVFECDKETSWWLRLLFCKRIPITSGYKLKVMGVTVYREQKKNNVEINFQVKKLKKKIKKYRFLSFFPLPVIQKKLKSKYKKYKKNYFLELETKDAGEGQINDTHGLSSSYLGVSDNEISLINSYAKDDAKRILLISHEASNTGAPRALLEMARVLKKNNYQVVYFSSVDGPLRVECDRDKIPFVVDEGVHVSKLLKIHIERFRKFTLNFDTVIINSASNDFIVEILKDVVVDKIWWLHEGYFYFKHHAASPSKFLQLCESVKKVYSVGCYAIKCTNNFIGKDVVSNLLYGLPDNSKSVLSYRNKDENSRDIVFGILGTLEPRKAQLEFVQAVKLIPSALREKAKFIVLGNQKLVPDYFKDVEENAKNISEISLLSDLPHEDFLAKLANIDIVVSCSKDDPMPIVLTEGLMCEKIIICTDSTGTSFLVEDGVNGFSLPTGDITALAEKMSYIIERYEELKGIGHRGREIYDNNFSEKIFEKNILSMLRDEVVK